MATSTSSTTTSDGKKVSKVKASTKTTAVKDQKGSVDDFKNAKDQKGRTECENGGSQMNGETAAAAEPCQNEPMGEPGTGSTDLVKEVTGLLKSMSSVKAVTVKIRSVGEAQLGAPGEVALLDGGATHGLRQAYP